MLNAWVFIQAGVLMLTRAKFTCSPRSSALQSVVTQKEYALVTSAADFGDWGPDPTMWNETEKERRHCKCLVEADRRAWAQEVR